MNRPEQTFQMAVSQYLNAVLPAGAGHTAFPSGGGGAIRGSFLKAMGLRAGMPDVFVFHQGRAFGIELKAEHGRLSTVQRATIGELSTWGVPVAVCKTLDEVASALGMWGIPIKGRLA